MKQSLRARAAIGDGAGGFVIGEIELRAPQLPQLPQLPDDRLAGRSAKGVILFV